MLITSSIVGARFHEGAVDKLLATAPGTEVILIREPENRYDSNAILCVVDGLPCGYIPNAQAERLAEDLDNGIEVHATLVRDDKLHIEVAEEPGKVEI
jgi:hypothetical protein